NGIHAPKHRTIGDRHLVKRRGRREHFASQNDSVGRRKCECRDASKTPARTMHRLFTISEDTTAFPWAKRTPGSGVLAVLAVGIALLAGWLTGHTSAGAIAAGS